MNKLRFIQHTESRVLLQLQVLRGGVWYTVPGTTVHSCNDRRKIELIDEYKGW